MKEIETMYGVLKGVSGESYYENGILKECVINKSCCLNTGYGELIPKYNYDEARDKYRNTISFYPSGELRSIYLDERKKVETAAGCIQAELLTFYENGTIHRLFPLYGQINGYWSEEEEMMLLENAKIDLNFCNINNKISCYCFYSSGKLKSLTLYKDEWVQVITKFGTFFSKQGISLYESGALETLEPAFPIELATDYGTFTAFNNKAIGIHGDANSVKFDEQGKIKSFLTIASGVKATDKAGTQIEILPKLKQSLLDMDEYVMEPISLSLSDAEVRVIDSDQKKYEFTDDIYQITAIANKDYAINANCSDCSHCNGCNSMTVA